MTEKMPTRRGLSALPIMGASVKYYSLLTAAMIGASFIVLFGYFNSFSLNPTTFINTNDVVFYSILFATIHVFLAFAFTIIARISWNIFTFFVTLNFFKSKSSNENSVKSNIFISVTSFFITTSLFVATAMLTAYISDRLLLSPNQLYTYLRDYFNIALNIDDSSNSFLEITSSAVTASLAVLAMQLSQYLISALKKISTDDFSKISISLICVSLAILCTLYYGIGYQYGRFKKSEFDRNSIKESFSYERSGSMQNCGGKTFLVWSGDKNTVLYCETHLYVLNSDGDLTLKKADAIN